MRGNGKWLGMHRRSPTLQVGSGFTPAMPAGRCAGLALATCLVLGACGTRLDSPPHEPGERTAIHLSLSDREHLRRGMQRYLASVQGIVEAVSDNKPVAISESAKNVGMGMLSEVPVSVAVRLPPEFLMLSMDTHQKFDTLSRCAAAGESKAQMLRQLGGILANCTACHATYRLAAD